MASCNNLAKVIKEHYKAQRHQEYLAKQRANSTSSTPKSPNSKTLTNKEGETTARAGLASVVEMDDFSGKEDNNLSGSDYSTYEVSRVATTSLASQISTTKTSDFNLDSGCSISMTPFISSLDDAKQELVPICLANNKVSVTISFHSFHFNSMFATLEKGP
ncbi:hypothetical protein PCANC_16735 [Puccinia coronata f. sp. avenae]|uniref:Uncharacterized protein n=1 Tax=Puccinia coronata f. sp. avenae TaxID=200324 RepID=A0A2N5SKU7_9BASI|nr:hypothetical protein PCANC_16735 [Puccinia coronata f. sp. avenae]